MSCPAAVCRMGHRWALQDSSTALLQGAPCSGQSWLPCLLNVLLVCHVCLQHSLFSSLPAIHKPDSGWVMRNAEADREGPWGGSGIPQHKQPLVLPQGRQLRDGASALRAGRALST